MQQSPIEVCGLKSRLYAPYSNLIKVFCEYEQDLEEALIDLAEKDTLKKRFNHLRKISDSISRIEHLMKSTEKYSYFCKFMITNSSVYLSAKELLKEEYEEVS